MKVRITLAFVCATTALLAFGYTAYQIGGDGGEYRNLEASIRESAPGLEEGASPAVRSSYDLSAHQTLSRVILLIREHYVEPDRVKAYEMFLAALDHVQKSVPEVLVDDSQTPERIRVSVGDVAQSFDLGGLDQLWEVTMALRDIFRFLQGHITDPELRRDIEYAAINGMLSTLDPHSVLLKPESFDEVKMSTKGEFGGLGIVIAIRDAALTIISPIEGTPASRSGLKAKDKIAKIGEESTINMSLEEAVQRLRGKPGTKIDIWVQRQGWTEARRYTLTRAIIKIESVTSKLLASGVGYVRIKSFQNNTYDDLHAHLEGLRKQNKKELSGLVLDFRNNPGGLLDQATLISDRFINKGALVITVGEGNRRREVKPAHAAGTETGYPIAVLVNGGSASASEIVAGALKNHDRAVVLGQSTFGKGSVQVLYDFKDGSALKLTIAQYLTPGDVSIQSIGISPDVEIRPSYITDDRLHLFAEDEAPREKDLNHHLLRHGSTDPQVLAALPFTQIANLLDLEEEEDQEANAASDKFRTDFEIELARDVVANTPTPHRRTMLESAKAIFEQRSLEQEQRIAERLRAFDVDWQADPDPKSAAKLQATVQLVAMELDEPQEPKAAANDASKPSKQAKSGKKKPTPSKPLTAAARDIPYARVNAGKILALSATVTNTGSAPIYRAFGVSESENFLMKNLEFAFGKIAPGESRHWTVKVKVPDDFSSRADKVAIVVKDAGKHFEQQAEEVVSILEQAKPRFSYTYEIDDRRGGNGDGLLQVGEDVQLKVSVRNLGPGAATDTHVTLKNLVGKSVFLKNGREKLGPMKSGEEKSATLSFGVREEIDVAKLRLGVWDTAMGASISEQLLLPVLPAQPIKPEKRMLKISGAKEVPLYAGANDTMHVVAYGQPNGQMKSDGEFASGWRRVELAADSFAYVQNDAVTPMKGAVRRTAKAAFRLAAPQSAPEMVFDLPSYVTTADTLRLKGKVRDERSLKDMFVFVNDTKVFYRTLSNASSTATAQGVEAAVDLNLALKEGSNTVTVVVRESDEMMSRQMFGVYRSERGGLAGTPSQPNAQ